MSDYLKTPCELKIRPHHGLCAEFFRGEGYSSDFTENMSRILSALNETNPFVILAAGADMICAECPNNGKTGCSSAEKVSRYDESALKLCGLSAGDSLPWSDFRNIIREKIVSANRLGEVCGDCSWYGICGGDM